MIKVENYPNAYKEVYEILKAVPKEDFDKIPTEFMQIVKKNMNVRDKVHLLIEQANEHGGHDNIAAVLIEGGR